MAAASPQQQDAWCDGGIDDSALAALDIDAAIAASAASAREVEADAVMSKDEVVQLREELRRAQDRVEELTSLLRFHSPSRAAERSHQRSPATRRQERVPLTASLSTNRSPEAARLKKAWCAAHAGKRQGCNQGRSSATGGSPGTATASPVVPVSRSVTGSQTSPQGISPNIRLPRTKMNQLHSEFACSICYELYTEPVSTPCGHNYCRCCLAKSFERLGRNCPQCRTRIPAGTQLQPNTALASGAPDFCRPLLCDPTVSRRDLLMFGFSVEYARVHVCLLHSVAAIALLFADELASRPEAMCSPVAARSPTVADKIASGALRRRRRVSREQRQGTLMRPRNFTDDNMQLAVAMSLSVQDTNPAYDAAAATLEGRHSEDSYNVSIREEFIDLRSDDEVDEVGDEVRDTSAALRHGPNPPTASATQRTGYRQVLTETSDSISDATIERLTGLRLL
eukprot:COSAG02_NODE_1894_length_10475_cov_10.204125_1_plen_454_part_00